MEPMKCARCQSPIQPAWNHCPACGDAIFWPDARHALSEVPIRGLGAKHDPIFDAELADGDISITPQMKSSYASEMRIVGLLMIVVGLAAFAITTLLLVNSAMSLEILDVTENQFYFYTAIAGGGILAIMAGVIFVSIPSKDGTTSALSIALGSMLSVTLGVLFAVILVLVFIVAMILAFFNACLNACQGNPP